MPSKKNKLKKQKNQSASATDESMIGQDVSQSNKSRQRDDYRSRY
ncbi:MAG: hypothetical protein JWM96_46 [Alphaproteobacteria bacterium]|nr:hypothetical protein [Alphaproteobacteria bacterium]